MYCRIGTTIAIPIKAMQMTSLVTFTSIRAIFGGKSLVFWWQKLSSVKMVKSCCAIGCVNRLTKGSSTASLPIVIAVGAGSLPLTERVGILLNTVMSVLLNLLVAKRATILYYRTMFPAYLNMSVVQSRGNE